MILSSSLLQNKLHLIMKESPGIIYLLVLRIIIDISNLILNGLTAHVLRKLNKTKITSQWFIYCLSISDVLVGLFGILNHVDLFITSVFTSNDPFDSIFCKISVQPLILCEEFSIKMILVISLDRCLKMKYLLRYDTILTKRRARFLVAFGFVLAFMSTLTMLSSQYIEIPRIAMTIVNSICILLSLMLYIYSYFAMKSDSTVVTARAAENGRLWSFRTKVLPFHKESTSNNECTNGFWCQSSVEKDQSMNSNNEKELEKDSNTKYLTRLQDESLKRKESLRNYPENMAVGSNNSSMDEINKERDQKIGRAILCILFALSACSLPTLLIDMIYYCKGVYPLLLPFYLGIPITLNSSLNAIVLILFCKDIRKGIRSILL